MLTDCHLRSCDKMEWARSRTELPRSL